MYNIAQNLIIIYQNLFIYLFTVDKIVSKNWG